MAACFNAVVDVADETRIEGVIASARDLLRQSNMDADRRIVAADSMNNGDPVWAILAAGILCVRLGRCGVYKQVWKTHKHRREMGQAYKILRGCQTRRTKGPVRQYRTRVQWAKLTNAADELVALLRAIGDAAGAPQAFGAVGVDAVELGDSPRTPGELAGATMADDADGADLIDQCGSGAGGQSSQESQEPREMDQAIYTALRPVLTGAIERMARSDDADGYSGGYVSGGRLGRNIEMAGVDGRCFARRNAEGERLHAAILLDTSGSMHQCISTVSGIA
jgi:hypothetical protein